MKIVFFEKLWTETDIGPASHSVFKKSTIEKVKKERNIHITRINEICFLCRTRDGKRQTPPVLRRVTERLRRELTLLRLLVMGY